MRRIERLFWRDIWDSVPAAVAAEHGIERRDFGPIQATLVGDLARVGMLNLVLGATDPGAVDSGQLGAALQWVRSHGVSPYVSVPPSAPAPRPPRPGSPTTAAFPAWHG